MLKTQGKDPVNFPRSEYDEAAILHFPDFDTFVQQKIAASRLKTKASKYVMTYPAPSACECRCHVCPNIPATLQYFTASMTRSDAYVAYASDLVLGAL